MRNQKSSSFSGNWTSRSSSQQQHLPRQRSDSVGLSRQSLERKTKDTNSSEKVENLAKSCPEARRNNGLQLGEKEDEDEEDEAWKEKKSIRKREHRRQSPDCFETEEAQSMRSPPLARSDSNRSLKRNPSLNSTKSERLSPPVTTPTSKRKERSGKRCPEEAPLRQETCSPDEVTEWNAEYRNRILRATPPPSNPTSDFTRREPGERWKGRLDYPSNGFYVGDLLKKDNGQVVRDGLGTAFDPIKNKIFEGTFVDDLKSGFGVTRYTDKVHQGMYQLGMRHGHGIFLFSNGEKYEGDFCRGEFHGKGKMTWKDGTMFEGIFKKGKIKKGIKRWGDRGESFEGYFDEKGARTGFGVTRYANGDFHRGYYRDGLANGRGERFDRSQGTTTYCEYAMGVPVKSSRLVITRGLHVRFAGQFSCPEDEGEWATEKNSDTLFGRLEGVANATDENDSDIEEQDRIQIQQGQFSTIALSRFSPRLVQGTYTTARSRVTAQHFVAGPLVPEGFGATWHDLETGNARWAKLGEHGVGPLGKALFVFAECIYQSPSRNVFGRRCTGRKSQSVN